MEKFLLGMAWLITFVSFVVIVLWCIWHSGKFENTVIEQQVIQTWLVAGLIPSVIFSAYYTIKHDLIQF